MIFQNNWTNWKMRKDVKHDFIIDNMTKDGNSIRIDMRNKRIKNF